jgi:hypothetical protein
MSRLAVFATGIVADAAGGAGWPMWQGNPWRCPLPSESASASSGEGLIVAGSHICYPSPLSRGPLRVRAEFGAACLVRAALYDLTGQLVVTSAPVSIPAGGPGEIVLPADGVASGLYLCRLVAERAGWKSETSIAPVAVAR